MAGSLKTWRAMFAFLLVACSTVSSTSACFSKAATFVPAPRCTHDLGSERYRSKTQPAPHLASHIAAEFMEFYEEESSKFEGYGKSSLVIGVISTLLFFARQGLQSIANIPQDESPTQREREMRVVDLESLVLCISIVTGVAAVLGNLLKWF